MTQYEVASKEKQPIIPTSRWSPTRVKRAGFAGLLGGLLWAVWPFGAEIALADVYQTRVMDSGAIAYGLFAVIPLALMIVGVAGLYKFHGETFGRLGSAGAFISISALSVMAIGIIPDFALYGTDASAVGHMMFLLGFLSLMLGSLILGIAVYRANRMQRARWLGSVLSIAIPVGIALVIAKETLAPSAGESDLWFWVAIMTAYGLSWILLGYHMRLTASSLATPDTPTVSV